ncbi:MAG: HNH endonuclease [Pseudomonadota bacterium]
MSKRQKYGTRGRISDWVKKVKLNFFEVIVWLNSTAGNLLRATRRRKSESDNSGELVLHILALNDEFTLKIKANSDLDILAFRELASLFVIDETNPRAVKRHQRSNDQFKASVDAFCVKYAKSNPLLKRWNKRISTIPNDEIFFVLGRIPSNSIERVAFEKSLDAVNGVELSTEMNESDEAAQDRLLAVYDVRLLRPDRRMKIGSEEVVLRCRFCGKVKSSTTKFSNAAHAIPEALGNKTILLKSECDRCNKYFGDEVEPSLIDYFGIERVMLKIPGKTGIPKIVFKNGMVFDKEGKFNISLRISDLPTFEASGEIVLESNQLWIPRSFYRALCKMSISTLNPNELLGLDKTIRWVRFGGRRFTSLPKVSINTGPGGESPAGITNYVRRSNDTRYPHVVSEFRIGRIAFVYILPFSRKDKLKFVKDEDRENYWGLFAHYNAVPGWRVTDLSSRKARPIVRILPMKKDPNARPTTHIS